MLRRSRTETGLKSRLPLAGENELTARKVIAFAFLGAILIAAQVALSFIPNIELVSMLIIVYTRVFGKQAFYPVAVFIIVQGLIYGFGLWWLNYLYVWPILIGIALLLRRSQSVLLWALISAAYGLSFGALCAIPYFFIGGPSAALAYWISGIPFDLAHCAGNFIAGLLLMPPSHKLLERLSAVVYRGGCTF